MFENLSRNIKYNVEVATKKSLEFQHYELTEDEKFSIAVMAGVPVTTVNEDGVLKWKVENASVTWNGEKFIVAHKAVKR